MSAREQASGKVNYVHAHQRPSLQRWRRGCAHSWHVLSDKCADRRRALRVVPSSARLDGVLPALLEACVGAQDFSSELDDFKSARRRRIAIWGERKEVGRSYHVRRPCSGREGGGTRDEAQIKHDGHMLGWAKAGALFRVDAALQRAPRRKPDPCGSDAICRVPSFISVAGLNAGARKLE